MGTLERIVAGTILAMSVGCKAEQDIRDTGSETEYCNTEEGKDSVLCGHQVKRASSSDGIYWSYDNIVLIDEASVPAPDILEEQEELSDGTVLDPGTIILYYVDGSVGPNECIALAYSTDNADYFTTVGCIEIEGEPTANVDPATSFRDHQRFLYYFAGDPQYEDPAMTLGVHDIMVATCPYIDSCKEVEIPVFSLEGVADPDVFSNGDLYILKLALTTKYGRTIVTTSQNGMEFDGENYEEFPYYEYGLSKPFQLEDGQYVMPAFNQLASASEGEISNFRSDNGIDWRIGEQNILEVPSKKIITDTQVVQLLDGSYIMIFKEADWTEPTDEG